jgi:hypothetical protein
MSSLVSIMDKKGVLGWSSAVEYTEPSIQFGSDGVLYLWLQPSGPTNGGPRDPLSSPAYWQTLKDSLGGTTNGIRGTRSNLRGSANGTTPVSTITADELSLESPSNNYLTVRNVSVSPSFANPNGANGLDIGTVQPNTFYDRWVISNGVTVAGLLVATPNAPAMPAGYTFKARVGTLRTGATATVPLPFIQFGNQITYVPKPGTSLTTPPVIASGVVAFPSTVGWGGYAPPAASKLMLLITHAQAAAGWLSNSVDYFNQYTQSVSGNSSQFTVPVVPLSGSIYWGASAGTMGTPTLAMMGWEEQL